MNTDETDTIHNLSHKLLGRVFEELLTPVNITVETGLRIMSDSPEADVLLIRRDQQRWTEAQRNLLKRRPKSSGWISDIRKATGQESSFSWE